MPTDIDLPTDAQHYIGEIEQFGPTDNAYLSGHFRRFIGTFRQFSNYWNRDTNAHVLDIGAHWLHQSVLFARAGFRVTAADFAATLELDAVKALARHHSIDLLTFEEIHSGKAFEAIPDDSIDVVLFTEILEHITFNPIAFWKAVYRMLRPKGRIIVTTPNFYAAGRRAWQWKRFLTGFGAGIDINEILQTPTYGHHWKEFSRREICHYFCALSPDFHIHRAIEVDSGFREPGSRLARLLRFRLPQIYCEVDLPQKNSGIVIEPHW
ncbi:MAG: methyltransferase domain-containing protein [Xanthomonadales bacterium]|nr:methyltransferase domain-containing protein [Xanthomonadales bacterium]